jgi:hypothetical protein
MSERRHKFQLWKYDGRTFYKCSECGEECEIGDKSTAWCVPAHSPAVVSEEEERP